MMVYVAQIEDGFVTRVVVSPASIEHPDGWVTVGPDNTIGIGWTYEGGAFVPPVYEESEDDA